MDEKPCKGLGPCIDCGQTLCEDCDECHNRECKAYTTCEY